LMMKSYTFVKFELLILEANCSQDGLGCLVYELEFIIQK
jgi:hypothetical protein